MLILNNGSGEIAGDDLVLAAPLQTPGVVWFVNSATGTDGASPAGRDREKPLATLAQAQTNASAGDTVFLEAGHTEVYVSALTISKQLFIAAGGAVTGSGAVSFAINAAANNIFSITAQGVELRNILFKASVQSNTGGGNAKINVSIDGTRFVGCRWEQSANDQMSGCRLGGGTNNTRFENCTFVSTAVTTATRPTRGLEITGAITNVELYGVTFDDGTVGFSTAAFDDASTITRLMAMRISALRGADLLIAATTTGWLNLATSTGGGRVVW